jgi:hypothetical protein
LVAKNLAGILENVEAGDPPKPRSIRSSAGSTALDRKTLSMLKNKKKLV